MSAASPAVVTGNLSLPFHCASRGFQDQALSQKPKPCRKPLSKVSCSLCLLQGDSCGSGLEAHQTPHVWGDVPQAPACAGR